MSSSFLMWILTGSLLEEENPPTYTMDTPRCVGLRTGVHDIPKQEILTKDSLTVSVDAIVFFKVCRNASNHHKNLSQGI